MNVPKDPLYPPKKDTGRLNPTLKIAQTQRQMQQGSPDNSVPRQADAGLGEDNPKRDPAERFRNR